MSSFCCLEARKMKMFSFSTCFLYKGILAAVALNKNDVFCDVILL